MTSKTRVTTESYLPPLGNARERIMTKTTTWASGDTPLAETVAGDTAGMIGQGNVLGHGKYLSGLKSSVIYKKSLVD